MAATPALDAIEADALGTAVWMLARIQQLDAELPPGTPTSGACRWCSVGDGWRCRLVRRTGRRTVERWLHCDTCERADLAEPLVGRVEDVEAWLRDLCWQLLTTPARERSRRTS